MLKIALVALGDCATETALETAPGASLADRGPFGLAHAMAAQGHRITVVRPPGRAAAAGHGHAGIRRDGPVPARGTRRRAAR